MFRKALLTAAFVSILWSGSGTQVMASTFPLPAAAITANVEFHSPDVAAPTFSQATVTLTDALGQWPATVDNTRHIIKWGFQMSLDGGANWAWGPVHQEEPFPGLPFGLRSKTGGLPGLSIAGSALGTGANTRLRLAILTDADITLGVIITVN